MPVRFGIWRVDRPNVIAVSQRALDNEARLEDFLERDISILGLGPLLILGRQVITDYAGRVDLLAIDAQGDLFVIELKKGRTPREVVAQALDYGFWVKDLAYDDVTDIWARHHDNGVSFEAAFQERFDAEPPEALNNSHQLLVVASELDLQSERIVSYISDYGLPINVVFFSYFQDGEREYLGRSWLLDPADVEEKSRAPSAASRKRRGTSETSTSLSARTNTAVGRTVGNTALSRAVTGAATRRASKSCLRARESSLTSLRQATSAWARSRNQRSESRTFSSNKRTA